MLRAMRKIVTALVFVCACGDNATLPLSPDAAEAVDRCCSLLPDTGAVQQCEDRQLAPCSIGEAHCQSSDGGWQTIPVGRACTDAGTQ